MKLIRKSWASLVCINPCRTYFLHLFIELSFNKITTSVSGGTCLDIKVVGYRSLQFLRFSEAQSSKIDFRFWSQLTLVYISHLVTPYLVDMTALTNRINADPKSSRYKSSRKIIHRENPAETVELRKNKTLASDTLRLYLAIKNIATGRFIAFSSTYPQILTRHSIYFSLRKKKIGLIISKKTHLTTHLRIGFFSPRTLSSEERRIPCQ